MDFNQILSAQAKFLEDYAQFWDNYQEVVSGKTPPLFITPEKGDNRFKSPDWRENPYFYFYHQTYLIFSKHCERLASEIKTDDPSLDKKIKFYTTQMVNALSPSNYVLTNPDVLKETLMTQGENLKKGFENFLTDWKNGEGILNISMTDTSAFKVGENLACTPGKVIFQNELIQLIQYFPTTQKIHQTPLLIVPPWINKYYILDLSEKNSFAKWAVDQGISVFMISWVNPDESYRDISLEDYLQKGLVAALDTVEKATGESKINMLGFCIGGTLLSMGLGYLQAKGDTRINSATYLATLIDFEDPGEVGVYINEAQISALETMMDHQGYLDGRWLMTTFNSLRANELLWSYYINNYLCGKNPFPFDLLYWNSDGTNMPAKMHSEYLRQLYLENRLSHPSEFTISGVAIDLSKVTTPCYFVSALTDHIAPWEATYKGAQCFSGPISFALSGSGHIAGMINPPSNQKYGYYYQDDLRTLPADPQEWLSDSSQAEGSWWPHWMRWLKKHSGVEGEAPAPNAGLPMIEAAPGSYVLKKLGGPHDFI